MKQGKVLQRFEGLYEKSLAFIGKPLEIGQEVHLKVTQNICGQPGTLVIGVTTNDPTKIDIDALPQRSVPELTSLQGFNAKHVDMEYIDNVSNDVFIHVALQGDGCIYARIDTGEDTPFLYGVDVGVQQWLLVDLYGSPTELTLTGQKHKICTSWL